MMPTYVSFYLDDVAPYVASGGELLPVDASALVDVLEYIRQEGIRGAISVIPGMYTLLLRPKNSHERRFAEVVARLGEYPVDPHMEIMTHQNLFDFSRMEQTDGPSEAEWLDDPEVGVEEYKRYFLDTIIAGRELGVRYTGLSTPGTHPDMNPKVWEALLRLAEEGEFPNSAVPVFATIEEGDVPMEPRVRARRDKFVVLDMPSGVWDYLASWRNSPDWVNVDHYVDGEGGGHLASLIKAGSFMAIFHMHWQGLNPQTGLGWKPFQEMIGRLKSMFGGMIEWKRPSEIALEFAKGGGPSW